MKKKRLLPLLVLPAAVFAALYGGGYIAQFIRNYSVWTAAGGMPGDGSSPAFSDGGLRECFQAVFQMPYGLYGIGICLALLGLLIVAVMRMGIGAAGSWIVSGTWSIPKKAPTVRPALCQKKK